MRAARAGAQLVYFHADAVKWLVMPNASEAVMSGTPEASGRAAGRVPAARDAGRVGIWLAILAAALIARIAFVALMPREILWSDGREYDAVARQLVDHGTYGMQGLRPPGYPTLMAAVYWMFGKNLLALRLVEAVLGTLSVGLIGLIGLRVFGRRAGLIAAALAALHPVLAFLPATEFPENFAVLLIVLALGAAFAALARGGWWRWAACGALFGLATLTRANIVTLLPGFALGAAAMLARERRGWGLPLVVTCAALALTLAPWIVRNHQVHGRWAFVSTGGGRQFWCGNSEQTTGSTLVVPQPDSAMQVAIAHVPSEHAMDAYYYSKGMEFIRAHPVRAAQLYALRLGNLFALYPEPVTRSFISQWSRWAQGLASVVIFTGVWIGLGQWKREPALWPMAGGIATFALVNALFFMNLRYRMAFEPCLLLMAGLGWAGLWERRAPSASTLGRP
jgi:4-amino-4-deoxy-L-arabinose transferase-like glycosyltransferase